MNTRAEVAKEAGVSEGTVSQYEIIEKEDPALLEEALKEAGGGDSPIPFLFAGLNQQPTHHKSCNGIPHPVFTDVP